MSSGPALVPWAILNWYSTPGSSDSVAAVAGVSSGSTSICSTTFAGLSPAGYRNTSVMSAVGWATVVGES